MRAVVTGANGTVGRALAAHLRAGGATVVPWDRAAVPVEDEAAGARFLHDARPDALFHLAVASRPTGREGEGPDVNVAWPGRLARNAAALGVPFVFTSSVMVFTDDAHGPFAPDVEPDAAEGYGAAKREAERLVRVENPEARIVRLGWQIGERPEGNTMTAQLAERAAREGRIEASTRWLPACSFLPDTAAALIAVAALPPGLYHVDSNRRWTFFEVARALGERHGGWPVVPTEDFVYDQRLLDPRLAVPPLSDRLPGLAAGP